MRPASGTGSSPLARGLHEIPHLYWCTEWDHPRSRGVYFGCGGARIVPGGSSPLARGLLSCAWETILPARIIPARAGFTTGGDGFEWGVEDHPRSRGVYFESPSGMIPTSGSSPLARGLRNPKVIEVSVHRIIPARAGFTLDMGSDYVTREDHPRSRGVYGRRSKRFRQALGSSPLARGLRGPGEAPGPPSRIIPARAGFTAPRRPPPPARADHPRSRGVYLATPGTCAPSSGSSPLARGLPRRLFVAHVTPRIIPARAGFTSGRYRVSVPKRDHPRSRGVYGASQRALVKGLGSSPLARGLPTAF